MKREDAPVRARRCERMDGVVGGQSARRDASPHHAAATERGPPERCANRAAMERRPVLTDALCASEKSPLESDLHGAQLDEQRQLSPPPEKEAVFRSYATMRKTRATNQQNTPPPEGRAPFRLPAARNLPFMACHRWK